MKKFAIGGAALAFAALLVYALLEFANSQAIPQPADRGDLPGAVATYMEHSGVEHPVTAVLLNFRGYDTLLEIAVLLLAPLVILAAGVDAHRFQPARSDPLLQALARQAVPLIGVAAIYLLWAGAYRPGGAFQAAALLAAAALLLHLTGLLHSWRAPAPQLRLGLVGGLLVFIAVAAALLLAQGGLLQYPPAHAGALILLIEASLACSLALVLAGLFLFLARTRGDEP